jgi:DNA-binding NarL/FixJ family response regulator
LGKGIDARAAAVGGSNVAENTKRILLVADHNAFREALAIRLNQEEDLEVAWQSGSMADTRYIHLNGVDVAVVDPLLPDGDGLELIREVCVANPNALALVLSHRLDPALYHQALGAGAVEVLATNIGIEEVINAVRRSAEAEE